MIKKFEEKKFFPFPEAVSMLTVAQSRASFIVGDYSIRSIDLNTWKPIREIDLNWSISAICKMDADKIGILCENRKVFQFYLNYESDLKPFFDSKFPIYVITKMGKKMLVGNSLGQITVVEDGKKIETELDISKIKPYTDGHRNSHAHLIFVGGEDGQIKSWHYNGQTIPLDSKLPALNDGISDIIVANSIIAYCTEHVALIQRDERKKKKIKIIETNDTIRNLFFRGEGIAIVTDQGIIDEHKNLIYEPGPEGIINTAKKNSQELILVGGENGLRIVA